MDIQDEQGLRELIKAHFIDSYDGSYIDDIYHRIKVLRQINKSNLLTDISDSLDVIEAELDYLVDTEVEARLDAQLKGK
jgi:hypothetical protein